MPANKTTLSVEFIHATPGKDDFDGLRVVLRYPKTSSQWDQTHDVPHTGLTYLVEGRVVSDFSDAELVALAGNFSDELGDLVQFAEENLAGLVINGEEFSWEDMIVGGYQPRSPSRRPTFPAQAPSPR